MNAHALRVLEFNAIRERLVAQTGFTNLPGAVSTSSGAMLEFAALG